MIPTMKVNGQKITVYGQKQTVYGQKLTVCGQKLVHTSRWKTRHNWTENFKQLKQIETNKAKSEVLFGSYLN